MGEFTAATAFRVEDAGAVLAAAGRFFAEHSCPAALVPDADPATEDEVQVFPPVNGWTVILWPAYFFELAAAEFMSLDLGALASTARIYDGDYWNHSLLRDGVLLDTFASMPDYFTDDADEVARLSAKYAGHPAVIAEAVGCPVGDLVPYLVHLGDDEAGKAFPDDEFALDSPWVFVDFWRRFGPIYPEDLSSHVGRIRLAPGWLDKLPSGDAGL
ncbi:hypothetical protein SAMN04488564_11043 [Lentzea waywayandensis]|uniref:Uncharacterized protein n=1 Tax=Lentzea waywayandensis TaxID=84724 RepID=A0A1I6F970_9PSEU|nr:hypothetical protein [Lentzea waywayandensis]SFR26551.1 hypothetical protein SAMN04488564_11043 [Lentzea waywayandensis]